MQLLHLEWEGHGLAATRMEENSEEVVDHELCEGLLSHIYQKS